jgi:hypothetical protein
VGSIRILDAHVAHERLDDEVVVINLDSGAYFALDGASADCWTLLASHTPVDAAALVLADRYATSHDTVSADVQRLAAELVREGLAAWDPTATPPADAVTLLPPCVPGAPLAYEALRAEKYDDMEELLLLDPIHEVDAAGWPVVPAESA